MSIPLHCDLGAIALPWRCWYNTYAKYTAAIVPITKMFPAIFSLSLETRIWALPKIKPINPSATLKRFLKIPTTNPRADSTAPNAVEKTPLKISTIEAIKLEKPLMMSDML